MSNINSSDRNQTGSIQAFQRDLPKRVRKPSGLARGTYLHAELTAPNPPLGVHAPESDIPRSRTVPSSVTQTPPRVQSIRAGPRSYARGYARKTCGTAPRTRPCFMPLAREARPTAPGAYVQPPVRLTSLAESNGACAR